MDISTSDGFAHATDAHRGELLAHCYRMLGSVQDAEDLLQETLLRAWRAREGFDPTRAGLRTWLYRIATNACLTAIEQRARRPLPSGLGHESSTSEEPLLRGEEVPWLQPIPDSMVSDPAGVIVSRSTLRLAFVGAMKVLPARQRAVLVLREVLGWPAAETARTLTMSVAAVNSALQRARATLDRAGLGEEQIEEPADPVRRAYVERYVSAFEGADLTTLQKLVTADVVLEMPPFITWFQGRGTFVQFIARIFAVRGADWRMVPVSANGQAAVGAYAREASGRYHLRNLQVLEITAAGIRRNSAFQDSDVLHRFDLAPTLDPAD